MVEAAAGCRVRPVPGEDGYFATESGEVWSTRRREPRKLKPCLALANKYHRGYLVIGFTRKGRGPKTRLLHHVILETWVSPRPSERHHARHLDDDPMNNNVSNLAWGLPWQNKLDEQRNGRSKVRRRFNASHIRAMLALRAAGWSYAEIGDVFERSSMVIQQLILGYRYKEVDRALTNNDQD